VQLPLMDREIPVILDDLADPEFGTGVVKVTPAHDPNDFEAGRRHNLPKIKVIDETARMTAAAGPYAGLDRFEARKAWWPISKAEGLLVKTEDYALSLGQCQRCKTVVEPLVSTQWFVQDQAAGRAGHRGGGIGPHRVHSGQLVQDVLRVDVQHPRLVHLAPALVGPPHSGVALRGVRHEIVVAREEPGVCPRCGSANLEQDTDVLDTWFSSALWPFSTLGWPDDRRPEDVLPHLAADHRLRHPVLLGGAHDHDGHRVHGRRALPQVYIHGLVRDAERQKMSKTRGNVVDPLVVTEKYGTDAVRMALLQGAAPGTDIVLTEERMESSRAFANKIWNAARFLF
jgi:valyl-tRNA synthetase